MTDLKPYRKTRTIPRKPKFQQFSPDSSHLAQMGTQLTLFPLHPENLFEEKELHDLFDQEAGGGATTLNGLLGASSTSSSSSSEDDALSPSLTCAYGGGGHDSTLEQMALRHKERVLGEEKWVLYSEVAAVPMMEIKGDAVISSSSSIIECCHAQGLSLKLDYEEILNAWSDKGSLYIEGECPQTVPDKAQDGANDVGCMANARLWSVPDDGIVMEDSKQGKVAHREARVMRYKEKRQSRLFSKRIRYEVRKLNAEKRPRMKGRFVKRKSEA